MARKKYIKSNASHPFSRLTGIEVIELTGELDCQIVKPLRIRIEKNSKQYLTEKVAYGLYNNIPTDDVGIVTHTCGIDQCIKPEHLYVDKAIQEYIDKGENSKELEQYIINNSWGKTPEEIEELQKHIYKHGIPKTN